MSLAYVLNTAWMWKCRGQLRAFHRAARDVAHTQAAELKEIIARNHATTFGRAHRFERIGTPREFQDHVPLSDYESYAESMHRIASGERNVLTRERVRLLEPTSGTSGGEKLIPYTSSLARQFQRAVASWVADLMLRRPAVRHGRAYWSISPALGPTRTTSGGIPIGFDDDTAYLGRLERSAARRLLAVPPSIARMADIENFRYTTLLHLVQADDLVLISIWSPTFLSVLLQSFEEWGDRMCYDLRNGSLSLPNRKSTDLVGPMKPGRPANVKRANELELIFRSHEPLAEKLRRVWPHLALISCWTDATAASYVNEIQRLFPTVEIQPKGLLATEGVVSVPLVGRDGAALALRSHFFEFSKVDAEGIDHGATDNCLLAHELSAGGSYRVILTTAGGLYRYQLHDVVEVVGFEQECPLLRFIGKSDRIADLVGEKLGEPHVRGVLARTFSEHGIEPSFSLVIPVVGQSPHYRLYIQGKNLLHSPSLRISLANAVQSGLEENPYYRQAIQLRQLLPLEVRLLDPSGKPGWLVYEQGCLSQGQKVGDIKPTALASQTGWFDEFEPLTTSANTHSHSHLSS